MIFRFKPFLYIFFITLVIVSCETKHYNENPVEVMIRSFKDVPRYSIILEDMDITDENYLHKYTILKSYDDGEVKPSKTDWKVVDPSFFEKHRSDLGMVIASKDSTGKVHRVAVPPGFNNYVGNPKYGQWETQNGRRHWSFFEQYLFLRTFLYLTSGPIYYNHYRDYRDHRSYGGGSYYGSVMSSDGRTMYGTKGTMTKKAKPDFFERKARSSKWNKNFKPASARRSGRGFGFGFGK